MTTHDPIKLAEELNENIAMWDTDRAFYNFQLIEIRMLFCLVYSHALKYQCAATMALSRKILGEICKNHPDVEPFFAHYFAAIGAVKDDSESA